MINSLFEMTHFMLTHISVNDGILSDDKYKYLFTVEEVNNRVLQGTPFREAYIQVGHAVNEGRFESSHSVNHTHAGSIGNLCTEQINRKMKEVAAEIG